MSDDDFQKKNFYIFFILIFFVLFMGVLKYFNYKLEGFLDRDAIEIKDYESEIIFMQTRIEYATQPNKIIDAASKFKEEFVLQDEDKLDKKIITPGHLK